MAQDDESAEHATTRKQPEAEARRLSEEYVSLEESVSAANREHADVLQQIRQQELDEYERKLAEEQEPELQRIRQSTRENFEAIEKVFGDQIRQWRKARNWSQEDLAAELNNLGFEMHQTTVAKIERGARPLRVAEAVALAHIMRVPPLAIFHGAGPETESPSITMMREMIEKYDSSITYHTERLDEEAKNVAWWTLQRQTAIEALNQAALKAELKSAREDRDDHPTP
ncbi:helix-turn-helix transcriptional regulator [Nocardia farcinica]|uniref:helix-turn-helix domain-containing protein n=1 Tax=Nocardia farcinica TaxID=37329 RepID=UPI001894180D|nr:helix-turn-helix transcriptional regulator [Nocardia farcinica]MBF6363180.1 helix-turn-helix transcriptional regulator [Nocardia farcinica]